MSHIPVICDRCRSTGTAGEGDFAHLGDLLDFVPVPRKTRRVDGWTPERQRAFVAALSASGSPRRAALAIGMAPWGADQLRKAEGSEGFCAAWDRAMAIAAHNGALRIASGVADVAARNAQLAPPPSRLRGREPDAAAGETEAGEGGDELKLEIVERLVAKFTMKVGQERECRLAGAVVEADFYLRQVTCLEVAFDLMMEGMGMDAWQALLAARRGGRTVLEIADTPMSRILDSARREQWASAGEPGRPDHPPERYLVDHGGYRTEELEHLRGGAGYAQQQREQAERHAADAAAQVEWEARNAAEAAEWRAKRGSKDKAKDGD